MYALLLGVIWAFETASVQKMGEIIMKPPDEVYDAQHRVFVRGGEAKRLTV
jgi:hypothetical protein